MLLRNRKGRSQSVNVTGLLAMAVAASSLAGCSNFGAGGPRTGAVLAAGKRALEGAGIRVVDVTPALARRASDAGRDDLFSSVFQPAAPYSAIVGRGDILDISIWEAPPAALFGASIGGLSSVGSTSGSGGSAAGHSAALPDQMVDESGRISVPFAGPVTAAGRTPTQIAAEITGRLQGIAHQPQVIVRFAQNANATVTVVGEVSSSVRMPLTPRGERLLDALAAAGGVRQPVGKMTVQLTRAGRTAALPLERVIREPEQNVRLAAGDVVTALYQPFSFTALGASGINAEINFEGTGLVLSQALGRIGGLRDERANPRGVFIFRFENPAIVDSVLASGQAVGDKIPVIYRVDLSNPANFFVAQNFPIRNRDVMYVSNAPLVDFQKFVTMVSQLAITGLSVGNSVP